MSGSIEIPEIYADPHLPIFLVERDDVRNPLCISAWPNEVCIE
jgi:hypothetical protein